MTADDILQHSPEFIAMKAKCLLDAHQEDAEHIITEALFDAMANEDVPKAATWLAILHEVREMRHHSTALN